MLRKFALISETFERKVPCDEIIILKKIVSKLLEHDPEHEENLVSVFGSLDEGLAVDIAGVEDTYAQAKLYKLFKIMRLRKSGDNELEFKKKSDKDIHSFNF